jgi:glycosyltransferase involved in cell wall biosynthesis
MTARPRVLFVAPVEPWCRENGSSLITADLLEALAALEEVQLLAVFVRRPPPDYVGQAPPNLETVLLDIPGRPRWASVASAALRGSMPLRHRFDNPRVVAHIRQALQSRRFEPELVHVEHLPLVDIGLGVARPLECPLVYRAHNVESRLWARRLHLPRFLKDRVVAHLERTEAEAVASVDMTLCISEGDLGWARQDAQARSALLPCTLRLDRYDSVPTASGVFEAQVCFVGGFDWAPNEDGLRWFVAEVLPEITKRLPGAGLAVLARGADRRSWLRDDPSIRILPPESEAARLFASSRVSIAPLFQAGGVRIKIPESLALGCPVVATTIGAEGHDLSGLDRADDAQTFADACLGYLGRKPDPAFRADMRAGVDAKYGASGQAGRLVRLWTQLVAEQTS